MKVNPNKVYLAFRRTPPSNPTLFQSVASFVTKARLVSQYCHGGVIVNNELLHVNTKHGLHKEDWTPENWDLFEVKADKQKILDLYERYKGTPYDWFSLIAFVGFSASDSDKLYCFEWMYLALTGMNPNFRVTPETLMAISLDSLKS
jgi:hypothetical protein